MAEVVQEWRVLAPGKIIMGPFLQGTMIGLAYD